MTLKRQLKSLQPTALIAIIESVYGRYDADYFHALLKLDKKKPDYQGLDDAQAFIRQLQQKHWRKHSFWTQADYPSKAG
ncbi:MAG: hypothetical protein IPM37_21925 [Hahellaceae bacterium]|nr:hypothetical protein [Hahellaceae bacterium]